MKPFDLMAALKGDKVITRSGFKVTLYNFYIEEKEIHGKLSFVNDQGSYSEKWDIYGKNLNDNNKFDLFVAPKKKKLWIGILKYSAKDEEHFIYPHAFDSYDRLNLSIFSEGTYKKDDYNFIEIEIDDV